MADRRLRPALLVIAAIALTAAATWRVVTWWYAGAADPVVERVERMRAAGDAGGLGRTVAEADAEEARLALAALGRMGSDAAAEIRSALADERPAVREMAALALGRAAARREAGRLADVAAEDESGTVRAAAVTALGDVKAYDQMETLIAALADPDEMVRRRAAAAIAQVTGITFPFNARKPDDPRHVQAVANLRRIWPKMRGDLSRHWTEDGAGRGGE
jgi:HEAT repeat protein